MVDLIMDALQCNMMTWQILVTITPEVLHKPFELLLPGSDTKILYIQCFLAAAALARSHWSARIERPKLTIAIASAAPTIHIFFYKNNDQIRLVRIRYALFLTRPLFELVSCVLFPNFIYVNFNHQFSTSCSKLVIPRKYKK
jgi:hypothetical protein